MFALSMNKVGDDSSAYSVTNENIQGDHSSRPCMEAELDALVMLKLNKKPDPIAHKCNSVLNISEIEEKKLSDESLRV